MTFLKFWKRKSSFLDPSFQEREASKAARAAQAAERNRKLEEQKEAAEAAEKEKQNEVMQGDQ